MIQDSSQQQNFTFGDHGCLLYSSLSNFRSVAVDYILQGLKNNEKVLCLIDEYPKYLLIQDLESKHINTEELINSCQLVINEIHNFYAESEVFNPTSTIKNWHNILDNFKKEEFSGLRVMAEMSFVSYESPVALNSLMEYELRSNTEILTYYDHHLYLCVFNKNKFPDYVLEDMFQKHNVIINDGEFIKPNPFFIDPKIQLKSWEEKESLRKYFSLTSTPAELQYLSFEGNKQDANLLRHVLRAAGDGIWECNIETDEVYFSKVFIENAYIHKDTKRKFKEILDLVHQDDIDKVLNYVSKCTLNELEILDCEIRTSTKEDGVMWFHVKGVPLEKDPGSGKISKMVGVFNNITEKKKIQTELNDKIYFEKLRTDFFANLSHELRTPINVILGSLQLQELYLQEDESSQYINKYATTQKRLKQNCYRLLKLVNNMIDITRIDAGFYSLALENIDIIKLINNILLSIRDYVENAGLRIEFSSTINELTLACDAEKVERIILNLLSNATKFTEPGGEISIDITKNDTNLIIKIKDTGRGIPENKLRDVFNRFSQVDKSLSRDHEGSGIGLALTKSLVELHGGTISVQSKLQVGSEFTIVLPITTVQQDDYISEIAVTKEGNVERARVEFSDIYL